MIQSHDLRRLVAVSVTVLLAATGACLPSGGGGGGAVLLDGDASDSGSSGGIDGGPRGTGDTMNTPRDGGSPSNDATHDSSRPDVTKPSGGLIASPSRLTDSQTVTFALSEADLPSPGDVLGVRLKAAFKHHVFGEMKKSGSTWKKQLSWGAIHAVKPINFKSESTRYFEAHVIRKQGKGQVYRVKLVLHCSGQSACDGRCGALRCDGRCRPLSSLQRDPEHCGRCNNRCDGGRPCRNGNCVCGPGEQQCGSECVDLDNDEDNCGKCGTTCAPDKRCHKGNCVKPVMGTRCNNDSDCRGGECLSVPDVPKICTVKCDKNATDDCPDRSICLARKVDKIPLPYCLKTCKSKADCDHDNECVDASKYGIDKYDFCGFGSG